MLFWCISCDKTLQYRHAAAAAAAAGMAMQFDASLKRLLLYMRCRIGHCHSSAL